MNALLTLPIVVPLAAAAVTLLLARSPRAQVVLTIATLSGHVALCATLLTLVLRDGISATQVGGWDAPWGITVVADGFAAIMLTASSVVALIVHLYALGHPSSRDEHRFFNPLYLVLVAGFSASFLAGDLFNLFVSFEIMLIASYVLVVLGSTTRQVRAGAGYAVMNLLASTLFITAVALVYAATGTVNLAQLAQRIEELPGGVATMLSLLLLAVFGIKAALFPLFFWLPSTYQSAATPVTAVFAGVLTKVGVYSIVRTQMLLFPTDGPSLLLMGLGVATMGIGVLGAIAQDDIKQILSFHSISQIGYMIAATGFATVAGLAAAIFYMLHHTAVKTSLFLVSGLVERREGTTALDRLGGMLHSAPLIATLFGLSAVSLAGFPPLSGFVAKLSVITAGLDAEQYAVVAAALLVSVGTLLSMLKVWNGVFWRPAPEDRAQSSQHRREPQGAPVMLAATCILVAVSVGLAVAAGPIYDACTTAANSLLNRESYLAEVLR